MWLRDSTNQMLPYVEYATKDDNLNSIFQGVIRKQIDCVLLDPYANAFNQDRTGSGAHDSRTPEMKPGVWEGKVRYYTL